MACIHIYGLYNNVETYTYQHARADSHSRRSCSAQAMMKYITPAGNTHLMLTSFQSHLLPPHFPPHLRQYPRPLSSAPSLSPSPAPSHHRLLVTQIWTLRLAHVVVPINAHATTGRLSCSNTASVICVAGQHMPCSARSRMSDESGG